VFENCCACVKPAHASTGTAAKSGSAAVQVGIATERIKELTDHLKVNKKDFAARRGLLQLVGKRKRHLQYIAAQDGQAYLDLIKKLGIRR
jgi:small subunit ribosomal protein S15